MASVLHSAGNFAARFCNELDSKQNFICSPLSVETLLALVTLGSSNDTRAELLTALDIPNEQALRSKFTTLTKTLDFGPSHLFSSITSMIKSSSSNKRQVTLKIANKICVKEGKALKPDLKKDAVNVFKSKLEQMDFSQSSDAANSINKWVANQTNNTIKDIVSPAMFNKDTGLVLLNAIYFHGFWETPFRGKDTRSRQFHVNGTTKIEVKMMELEGPSFNYKHSPELKAKILQMFYEGEGEASMVIVLPDEIEGLGNIMQSLTAGFDLMEDIKTLKKTPLYVVIPKFKAETEIDLKKLLPKMGIKTIFDKEKSDINMLSSDQKLFVSEAIQKAFIVVDEEGTEAAASSKYLMAHRLFDPLRAERIRFLLTKKSGRKKKKPHYNVESEEEDGMIDKLPKTEKRELDDLFENRLFLFMYLLY